MACLTVVNYTPFTDEFRPPYYGTVKTRRRFSDLNLSLLPNRTAPNPKSTAFEGFHLDSGSIYPGADPYWYMTNAQAVRANNFSDLQYLVIPIYGQSVLSLMAPVNQQWWYRREWGSAMGALACYVLHNYSDRDVFLANIMQVAIDAYPCATGFTGVTPFSMGAGFYPSPLWFIRFAGLLFNDTSMKNAASIATTKTDWNGNAWPKWGEQQRVYFSATANAQYRLPAGYSGLTPLFGDKPDADYSNIDNRSKKDPTGVFDAYAYRYWPSMRQGIVTANSADGTTLKVAVDAGVYDNGDPLPDGYYVGYIFVARLDLTTTEKRTITAYNATTRVATVSPAFSIAPDTDDYYWLYASIYSAVIDTTYNVGQYLTDNVYGQENYAQFGCFMASIIMQDEGYMGGAVAAYNRRWANDPQMWNTWGINFDYTDTVGDAGFDFYRDIKALGGTGNLWMTALWDALNIITPGTIPITGQNIVPVLQTHTYNETIVAGALPITGQSITPNYAVGGSPVTVFEYVILGTETRESGWGGYTIRQTKGAANLGAATGQHARVTLGYGLLSTGTTVKASIGQKAASGDPYDTTALVPLTGGDFPGGVYTAPGFVAYIGLVSDWILLNEPFDNTKAYTVASYVVGAAQTFNIADANDAAYYSGVDTTAVADPATGSVAFDSNANKIVIKIEIKG
jgi:hypothetical protein